MGRIIAIDYGQKRTGMAVTDPAGIIASPLATIPTGEVEKFLDEYNRSEGIDALVIGYPVTLNNMPSEMVKEIDPFIRRLRKLFPGMEIYPIDERFTSSIAHRAIIDGGVNKKKRGDKGLADRISASLILQTYLEMKSRNKL